MRDATIMTIDDYINRFSPEVVARLELLRETIHTAVPDATEKISWDMPTFFLFENLVHFAAFKKHIGLYPGAEGVEHFQDRLTGYHYSKGAIQFPNDQPLPLALVTEIVRFRAEQILAAHASKAADKEAGRIKKG